MTSMYPPHHYGGYELSCRDVVDRLRARGHKITVLTTNVRVYGVKTVTNELKVRLATLKAVVTAGGRIVAGTNAPQPLGGFGRELPYGLSLHVALGRALARRPSTRLRR